MKKFVIKASTATNDCSKELLEVLRDNDVSPYQIIGWLQGVIRRDLGDDVLCEEYRRMCRAEGIEI